MLLKNEMRPPPQTLPRFLDKFPRLPDDTDLSLNELPRRLWRSVQPPIRTALGHTILLSADEFNVLVRIWRKEESHFGWIARSERLSIVRLLCETLFDTWLR